MEGLRCVYNNGLSNNTQSNEINCVKINKKMLNGFLVDIMCIEKPIKSNFNCCNGSFISMFYSDKTKTKVPSSGLLENNGYSKSKSNPNKDLLRIALNQP